MPVPAVTVPPVVFRLSKAVTQIPARPSALQVAGQAPVLFRAQSARLDGTAFKAQLQRPAQEIAEREDTVLKAVSASTTAARDRVNQVDSVAQDSEFASCAKQEGTVK